MNIPTLKKLVSEAYIIADGDMTIPKFATQFTFSDVKKQILIRIPVYEDALSGFLFSLIFRVTTSALPHIKLKPEELRQKLIAALEGKVIPGDELDIRAVIQTTGKTAHAITETRILITEKP